MEDNLDQQLDDVTNYISEYWKMLDKLTSQRLLLRALKNYPGFLRFSALNFGKLTNVQDLLSGRTPDFVRNTLLFTATEDEKDTSIFQALTSDYTIDHISRKLEERFKNVDFGKIKQLYDTRKIRLELNVWQFLGLVLGAGSLILKTIPQKVVEENLNMVYVDFEVKVFWLTMAVIGYLAFITLPVWWDRWHLSRKHNFVAQILEYTSIRKDTA